MENWTPDEFLPPGNLLERESGDGDSGAECKELSTSPLAARKDFIEITDALTTITREVQGEERPRETKKCSRIPVRQTRTSMPKGPVTKTETDDFLEAQEKWREIQQFVEDEEYARLEDFMESESFLENLLEDSSMEDQYLKIPSIFQNETDFIDIFNDLNIIPLVSNSDTSLEESLSPKAPLASEDPSQTTSPEDLSQNHSQDDQILEAPEEFRSNNIPQEETSLSTATVERDRDKDTEPEMLNKDQQTMGTARTKEMEDINIRGTLIGTTMAYTTSGRLETVYECEASLANSVLRGRTAIKELVTQSDTALTYSLQQFPNCDVIAPDFREVDDVDDDDDDDESETNRFSLDLHMNASDSVICDLTKTVTNPSGFDKVTKSELIGKDSLPNDPYGLDQEEVFNSSALLEQPPESESFVNKVSETLLNQLQLSTSLDEPAAEEVSELLTSGQLCTASQEVILLNPNESTVSSSDGLINPTNKSVASSVSGSTLGKAPSTLSNDTQSSVSSFQKDDTHMDVETMMTTISRCSVSCVRDCDNSSATATAACVDSRTLGRAAVAAAAAASALVQASIGNTDALRTARGSRDLAVKVRASQHQHTSADASPLLGAADCCTPSLTSASDAPVNLNWDFRNGRLVFIPTEEAIQHDSLGGNVISSGTTTVPSTKQDYDHSCAAASTDKCLFIKVTDEKCIEFPSKAPEDSFSSSNKCSVGNPTIFDCLDKYTNRIETEILKCAPPSDLNSSSVINPVGSDYLEVLRSRDINKRPVQGRLKLLESKLKEAAGLTSTKLEDVRRKDKFLEQSSSKEHLLGRLPNSNTELKDKNDELHQVFTKTVISEPETQVQQLDTQSSLVVEDSCSSVQVVDQSPQEIRLDRNDNECKTSEVASSSRAHRREDDASDEDSDYYPQIEITELGSPADLDAFLDDRFGGRCEFDVKRIGAFTSFGGDSEFYLVYDELDGTEEPEDPEDSDTSSEGITVIGATLKEKGAMRGDGGNLEGGPKRHNPDHDNLKSLLKKPGRGHHKKNRVSFNENKNEFFDADYIILIREECDYDEDDEDGVCTCNQHEMVRLTCCEPNCNCNYEEGVSGAPSGQTGGGRGYDGPTPQSPKFAPPLEFVDSVTLSPPEGYKDMDLGEQQLIALQQIARHRQQQQAQQQQQQQQAVCRECSGVHDSDSNSGSEVEEYIEKPRGDTAGQDYQATSANPQEDKEKTDQSQQTTPTTPPADGCTPVQSRYIMETITMTTVTERRMVREVEEAVKGTSSPTDSSPCPSIQGGGSPISGILKGGKLWKQSLAEGQPPGPGGLLSNQRSDNSQLSDASNSVTSDEEGNTVSRRSVRFSECDSSDKRDSCDGEADPSAIDEVDKKSLEDIEDNHQKDTENCNNSVSPDATEMMLTFKLGNHVLISNNSLRPNSAVRQLFPCGKPGQKEDEGAVHQYLVTAESLRAFEEAKRSKLPQIIQGDNDDTIRRTIERNTLRRSLIRYEPRSKKQMQKTDNSLVERIKQLTCDVDEPPLEEEEEVEIPPRGSPPGEESTKPDGQTLNNRNDKSFSPSSSASSTSSNSSMSSTYKKITDLFGKKEKFSDAQNNAINDKQSLLQPAPDLGNGGTEFIEPQNAVAKVNTTSEARKQFLSTLAPLTACVGGSIAPDEYHYQYQLANNAAGERASVASTVGTEYSLEDIDEALKNDEESKKVAPDVLVGTPSASESTDELAMFVQQDAGRIERIKKRYQSETAAEEDDEHDDYGFNRRPSVRGIKPRFGSTNEILQQIQSQLQPPAGGPQGQPGQPQAPQPAPRSQTNHVWPYYSETTGLKSTCPTQYYPYEELKARTLAHQYRPTSLIEESLYQNCPNQRCPQVHYPPTNVAPVMRIGGGGCADFYQTLPARTRTTRPESPPPMEISRSYHQTMVLIPYNRIENFQTPGNVSPNPLYSTAEQCNYARFKKIPPNTKRYPEPLYHGTLPRQGHHLDSDYQLKMGQKMIRVPYTSGQPVQVHLMASRSESPVPGQFATARATQTCSYYNPGPPNTRYRPAIGPGVLANGTVWAENPYGTTKINRHSFPAGGARYMTDNISLADSEHSMQLPNGYRQSMESAPTSPTKVSRFSERGVPEGAASVSPQDSVTATSTMTSPTSPQNPTAAVVGPGSQGTTAKSLYYAMNV